MLVLAVLLRLIKLILSDPVEEIELRSYSAQRWTLRLTPTLRGSLATLDHLGSLPPCYTRKLAAPTSDPKEKHIRWLSFQIFQIFQLPTLYGGDSNCSFGNKTPRNRVVNLKHPVRGIIRHCTCFLTFLLTWSHMKRPGNSGQLQSSVVMGLKGLTSVQFTSLMLFVFSFFCR